MAKMKNTDSCSDCLFFVVGERMGICKRFPTFVNKSNEDWCGEWRLEESRALQDIVVTFTEPAAPEVKKSRGRPKKA